MQGLRTASEGGPVGRALEGPPPAAASAAEEEEGEEVGDEQQRDRRPTWHVRATTNLQVEDLSLLRGMPLARGLRGFASVLSARPATAQYYELSAPVDRIDTFISHNWNTPRWRKFLVLAFHFNIILATVLSTAVAVGASALTASGVLPTSMGILHRLHDTAERPRGFLCLPLGMAAFFLSFCFAHELDWVSLRRCARRHVVFLDKTCVHQTLEDRKRAGIECLAAFLARSDAFLVVYSDIYMQRLWTLYECASWLLLHPGEPIILRPVLVPVLVLGGVLVVTIWNAYLSILHAAAFTEDIPPVMSFLLVLPLCIGARLIARMSEDQEANDSRIKKFSLADAKCASEDDRRVVQANIVAFMKLANMSGPDDTDGQVYKAFEALVKREVPKLMRSSSSRVGIPYVMAVCPCYPDFFGSLDVLAGFYLDRRSARFIALRFVMGFWISFLMWPMTLAFMAHLTRRPCLRGKAACAGIGISAFLLVAAGLQVVERATAEAESSDDWLALLLPLYGLSCFATWRLYRPA